MLYEVITVWTVLGECADFPHNSIAEPDRTVDNSTIWTDDFNRGYYMGMLFDRITSYNVCYTKLLRLLMSSWGP